MDGAVFSGKKLMFPWTDVSTAGLAVWTAIMGRFPCAGCADLRCRKSPLRRSPALDISEHWTSRRSSHGRSRGSPVTSGVRRASHDFRAAGLWCGSGSVELVASTVEDGPPVVVVPLIGVDSPIREAGDQYIGGAFGEDGEGLVEVVGVAGIRMEAENGSGVVDGELGERVAGEEVTVVVGGIRPEIANDPGGMSGGVEGDEVGAEVSFAFGECGDRFNASFRARVDFCLMSSHQCVVVVGERRDLWCGLIAVVQQDHGNSAEFVDVVVVALDSGRRVNEGVAGFALQEEATRVGRSPKKWFIGACPQSRGNRAELSRSDWFGPGKLMESVVHRSPPAVLRCVVCCRAQY
jgi:hypothetical protein